MREQYVRDGPAVPAGQRTFHGMVARLQDMLGFDLAVRHHDRWERSAIVTDIAWMAHATKLFAWMIPGEARVFPRAELDQAKTWVAGAAS